MGYVMADIFAARGNIAKKYAFPYMGDTFATKVSSGEFMINKIWEFQMGDIFDRDIYSVSNIL